MKTKVYLSGKIGTPEEALFAYPKFEKAENKLKEMGYDVVNPMKLEHNNPEEKWHLYMRTDIKHMMDCDCIFVLEDWIQSKGAKIEVGLAFQLGFLVFDFETGFSITEEQAHQSVLFGKKK